MLDVEIIYATLASQEIINIQVEQGASIESCILQSKILDKHPEIDLTILKVGIFSQVKPLSHQVQSGDRIEIYRQLIADPKAVRRKKAEQANERAKK